MSELAIDIAAPEQRAKYPAHGWAANSQGIRLLWFPLLRLTKDVWRLRKDKGVSALRRSGNEEIYFAYTLGKYCVALRELHKLSRIACERDASSNDGAAVDAFLRADELGQLYADSAVLYLRRLADRIASAAAPALFAHYKSAPRQYKNLVTLAKNENELTDLLPICDAPLVCNVICRYSGWFAALRGISMDGKKGVRDVLEHRGHLLSGVLHGTTDNETGAETRTFEIMLQSSAGDVELLQNLLECLGDWNAELCLVMDGLCRATGWSGDYQSQDVLMLAGNEEDIVGFWPEI